jgi:acyl-CoA thioester hydrolase
MHHQETQIHRYPLMVLESHLDSFGHMNHGVYLPIFEEARWDWVTSRGYGIERMHETGLAPVILEVSLQFRRELRLRQKFVIETQVQSYDKKLAVVRQEIKDDAGKTYCTALIKFGLFNIRERKLVNPTPEWLHAIGIPT